MNEQRFLKITRDQIVEMMNLARHKPDSEVLCFYIEKIGGGNVMLMPAIKLKEDKNASADTKRNLEIKRIISRT